MAPARNTRRHPRRFSAGGLLLLLPVVAWSVSCGDSSSGPGGKTVSSVVVAPSSSTLTAIGSTAQLTASAKNAGGNAVSGATFDWSSGNLAIATVSGSGLVTAVGEGATLITATAAGTSVGGTALVTVEQGVASISVTPQDGSIEVGQTLQLSAAATDAGGTDVAGASFSWASSDNLVATVNSAGLVTGVLDGSVTITATSRGTDGTAGVTVLRSDMEIAVDTELSGEVRADLFKILPGVTVTAIGDLTIAAQGFVDIRGTLSGDCVAITVQGDTAVTVGGTVDNGCAAGVEGEDLSIGGNGELTLEDATITSSGDITFTNDPTLTVDLPSFGMVSAGGHRGPERAGPGVYSASVSGTTVGYAGVPARDGMDGSSAEVGAHGNSILFLLMGDADFTGNTLVWAQDGGNGGDSEVSSAGEITAIAGDGGGGGIVHLHVPYGSLNFSGPDNVFRGGSGGMGGSATATGLPNSQGAKAPTVQATGGNGGDPGHPTWFVAGEISVAQTGSLILEMGLPGDGGDATAVGADGRDAESDVVPSQAGGDVAVLGGAGGSIQDRGTLYGSLAGSDPVFRGSEGLPLSGGSGGKAMGTAGNGGGGIQSNKAGADGGDLDVQGGGGGSVSVRGFDGELLGDGGRGGGGRFLGGQRWKRVFGLCGGSAD